MKKMTKILSAVLAGAVMVTTFAACGGNESANPTGSGAAAEQDLLAQIKAKGVLVMGTNAQFPPFEYIGDNGKVAGVDVDISQAIADKIGVKLEVQDGDFNAVLTGLGTGKYDIGAAGMTVTPEREEEVDFSDSYFTSIQYLIVKEDSSIKTVEDLAGKKVGVQLGTTGDFLITKANEGEDLDDGTHVKGVLEDKTHAEVSQMKSAIEATQDLINGRLDAVIIDKLPAESLVKQNEGKGIKTFELTYADGSKTDEQYAIAVPQGEKSASLLKLINEVIAEMNANNALQDSINKHSGVFA